MDKTGLNAGREGSVGINQYLTFTLGNEDYGVEILKVQEIKGYSGITPVPNSPPWMKGVMNLRGTVVPVVDLRATFGMDNREYTRFTVIILVTVGTKIVGLVVDAVSDVLDLPAEQVRPAPDMGSRVDVGFIIGMATVGGKLVVLLDVDKLLNSEEITGSVQAAA